MDLNPDRLGEIIDHLQRAVSLSPHLAKAHHRLGNAYVLMAQRHESGELRNPQKAKAFYKEALEAYRRALELNPTNRAAEETARQVANKLQVLP